MMSLFRPRSSCSGLHPHGTVMEWSVRVRPSGSVTRDIDRHQ